MQKQRLDLLLVERGLAASREKARGLILSGRVSVDGARQDKAGYNCRLDADITVQQPPHPYVSRGGLKLEKAIQAFSIDLRGLALLDVGSSTGGFTDCALRHGAERVIALDVGTGQLDWSLRGDSRVHVMERTNIRQVKVEDLPFVPQIVTIDVSFISLQLVLPVVASLVAEGGLVIALIKPQFEAGREAVSRGKGVIRDKETHISTISSVLRTAQETGLGCLGLTWSPILGPEGNMEFICCLKQGFEDDGEACADQVTALVKQAHKDLLACVEN